MKTGGEREERKLKKWEREEKARQEKISGLGGPSK